MTSFVLPGVREGVIGCPGVPSLGQVLAFTLSVQWFDELEANHDAHEPPESDVGIAAKPTDTEAMSSDWGHYDGLFHSKTHSTQPHVQGKQKGSVLQKLRPQHPNHRSLRDKSQILYRHSCRK